MGGGLFLRGSSGLRLTTARNITITKFPFLDSYVNLYRSRERSLSQENTNEKETVIRRILGTNLESLNLPIPTPPPPEAPFLFH